jgi:ligand-binding sensor domain-containing protein
LQTIDAAGNAIFKSYGVAEGLPSDILLSIREDNRGNLWMSTENGISKFIPEEERFENYADGHVSPHVRFSEAASA